MCRTIWAIAFFGVVFFSGYGSAQEGKVPPSLAALEEAMQEAIRKAEPGVACVLVSRNEAYRRFRPATPSAPPGHLGGFDVAKALHSIPRSDEKRIQRIRDLDLSDPDTVPEAYGSGIVLDTQGLILTCAHVVQGATKIYVRLPGGKGSYADIHALDPRSDLAVLRLITRLPGLKPIPMGRGGKLRKGQFVLTLTNPYASGFRDGSPGASWGIISNLRRRIPGATNEIERNQLTLAHFGTLLQLDTRLNTGCSGGAVLNLQGELVGITTAQAALTGLDMPGGFALPLDGGVRRIVEVLKRGEEVEYGFVGVQFDNLARTGVRIRTVIPGSPAKQGGLQDLDYILAINGTRVQTTDDVFLLVGMELAGTTVEIERARTPTGPSSKIHVTLAKFYVPRPFLASKCPPARGGLRVDYASILYQRNRGERWGTYEGIPAGVVVREVIPNSNADKAQLQPDKVIIRVNGQKVTTPQEFYNIMAKASSTVELTLLNADGGEDTVRLKLDEP